MRKRVPSCAAIAAILLLIGAAGSCAQPADRLTSLAAIHAISNETAARSLAVAFQGTVTYYEKGNIDLFVQDKDAAIYVETVPDLNVTTGDRVLVEGVTRASFHPELVAKRVTLLSHGPPPTPVSAQFAQLIRAELDCRRVKVRAVVRAASKFADGSGRSVLLDLVMPGGPLQAQIGRGGTPAELKALLDSTVDITGAAAGKFDNKNQMTGILLEVPEFSDVRVIRPAARDPRQLPTRSFGEILDSTRVDDQTERVRVQGTITYYQPGAAMVLQNGSDALWVDTRSEEPFRVGDHALVSGFPDVRSGSVVLTRGEIETTRSDATLQVPTLDARILSSGTHAFELVSVEGRLAVSVRQAAQDQYVIASQGHVFSAIYRHPQQGLNLPVSPLRDIRPGSRVRLTGICVMDRGDQFRGTVAFHLLLRSSDDIAVLAGPSPISIRNLAILLGCLLIITFLLIARALLLERKLRRQDVATAATVERWRTRVIDGINDAIPLRDTLLQITELISFKLQSDYCWIEVEMEGTFGNCPTVSERTSLEIIQRSIPGRSGDPLGVICAAFRSRRLDRRIGPDAFDNAVRLAALAIETGGRYSDLVRRSELDALTEAHNRFAFERAIDLAIKAEKERGEKFGLVYIDLDDFKQVNDRFGHQIGDRFLQETVARLSRHLRTNDMLARVGGDEFAVLLTGLKNGEELQEITLRLQSCFGSPVCLADAEIPASASFGTAVYPDDADSKAALLECADARMYATKRQRSPEPIQTAF